MTTLDFFNLFRAWLELYSSARHVDSARISSPDQFYFLDAVDADSFFASSNLTNDVVVVLCSVQTDEQVQHLLSKIDYLQLWCSALPAAQCQQRLRDSYLDECVSVGSVLSVDGCGVMLVGPSAYGKSELVLSMLDRGHTLVVDDGPVIEQEPGGSLVAHCPCGFEGVLFLRDIGVFDVRNLSYKHSTFVPQTSLDLVVQISQESTILSGEDIVVQPYVTRLMQCLLPLVKLNIHSTRPRALLLEVVVRQHQLRLAGVDAAVDCKRQLDAQLQQHKGDAL